MRSLHVLLTVDPEIPVPPKLYGGIERIVDMLVRGLGERGHRVTLLAHPSSSTPADLIPLAGSRSQAPADTVRNTLQVWRTVRRRKVDLVHSFGRLAYLLPLLPGRLPKIQSYQRQVTPRSVRWAVRLARGTLDFTACSAYCAGTAGENGGRWTVIPNGVPTGTYDFRPRVPADAPLIFLGRVERIKGAHTAIAVARATGRRLLIAGNHATEGEDGRYFREEILPHCDSPEIRYLGPVDDEQKNEILGGAAALLFPIEWDEPFGIVMAEALACGTPVIAFRHGAVPEVIEDGVNGFICRTTEEMIAAVGRVDEIDRRRVHQTYRDRFANDAVVGRYEQLYRSLVGRGAE